jgi:hypothetical protein
MRTRRQKKTTTSRLGKLSVNLSQLLSALVILILFLLPLLIIETFYEPGLSLTASRLLPRPTAVKEPDPSSGAPLLPDSSPGPQPTKTPTPPPPPSRQDLYTDSKKDPDPVDSDQLVNCKMAARCGGGYILLTQNECDNTVCCHIAGKWILYLDKDQCRRDKVGAGVQVVTSIIIEPSEPTPDP